MSQDLVVGLLGGGSLAAIVGSVVTALLTRRKLGAEATEIITNAASSVVTRLEAEVQRAESRMAAMRDEHLNELTRARQEFAEEREQWRRVLQLHVAWDAIAIAEMSRVGIDLPPAPPLTPPQELDLRA